MLALSLGKTVGEIRQMPAAEFNDWWHLYLTEPWGEVRADWRAAMTASVNANLWSKKKTKAADFMPKFKNAVERMSDDQMRTNAMLWAAVFKNQPSK